jgi:hypothetical protein
MKNKFSMTLLVCAALLALNAVAFGQQPQAAQPAKPVAFAISKNLAIGKLSQGGNDVYDMRGKLTFTVTAANSDDTVAGTVTYTIPDDARQKIAEFSGKPLAQVPKDVTKKDVVANFQKGTEPPVIHLELTGLELDVAGVKARLNRVTLDINAQTNVNTRYTKEEMEALFTVWARQINNGRSRRGPIARMNKVINGEEDPQ